jgi:hypothetical protein
MPRRPLTVLAWLFLACAHGAPRADPAALKPLADHLMERTRWKDFLAIQAMVVPERRETFLKAREDDKDERDLSFSECELEKVELAPDGSHATVTAAVKWVKLPSSVEQSAHVKSELWDYRGSWLLARQEGGPFEELAAPYAGPPDAGL